MKIIRKYFLAILLLTGEASGLALTDYGKLFEVTNTDEVVVSTRADRPALWGYSDCLDWAIAHNPDIRESLLNVLEAQQDILSAKDAWLPTVNFSTTQGYVNYPVSVEGRPANAYNSNYGVNASWVVWEGNVRKYRLESAKLFKQQQQLSGEDLIKELQVGILQAYLNILYAKEAIVIAEQTLEVSTTQTERMRKLVDSGRESKVDLAQLESQRAEDEYNLTQAKSSLVSSKLALKKLLALGLDEEIEIADLSFSESDVNSVLPSPVSTYSAAVGWLPAFKSNTLSSEIYANDVRIAEATNAPDISLQGGVGTGYSTGGRHWDYQMGHGVNESLGLSFSIPLYDGNKKKRAVAKAKLSQYEADIERDRLLNELSQTIENLYIDAENSRAKYKSGMARLAAMEETSRLVDRQFELGLVNPLELLTAHNNLLNARLEQLQNKYMSILSAKTIQFYATSRIDMP